MNRHEEMSELDDKAALGPLLRILSLISTQLNDLGNNHWNRIHMDRPFDKEEAARYLGINPDTVCKWARQGRIAYCRLGDGARAPMRFSKKDLDAFLSASRIPTVEEISNR